MAAWCSRSWRGPAGVGFRQCLRTSAPATAIATVIAIIAHAASHLDVATEASTAAASPWLTLPLMVAAFACSLTAAATWPLFALQQPGADTIRRLQTGLLAGRGKIAVGALLAQLSLTIPITIVLCFWFDAPGQSRRHYQAQFTGKSDATPGLNGKGEHLTFALTDSAVVESLWLRPRASLPTGPGATEVSITTGDRQLASTPVLFSESGALLRVAIEPQLLDELTITQTAGNVPLFFLPGSVTAIGPADLPTWLNCLLAALLAASTTAVTLLLAALLGLGASFATLATAICCAQFVQWIGGIGPMDDALLAVLRGQWLL